MAVKFSNNFSTSLAAAASSTATTLELASVTGLPTLGSGDYTYLTIDTDTASPTIEVVKVTAINTGTNEITVTRGQDNTTASAFDAGTKVELRLTSILLNDVSDEASVTDWGDILNKPSLLLTNGDGSDLTDVRAETVEVTVKNVSGGSLSKGTPVHQTGTSGSSTFEVVAANASSASTMPAHFVLLETLADQAEGRGLLMGRISGIDTSSFSEGDTIYVAAGGGFTNSPPTGEGNLIQNLGTVTRVDSTNGGGEVMGAGRSNATPNLNDGNIFLGNASNQAATASLSTSVSNLSHYNNTNWDTAYGWGDHGAVGYLTSFTETDPVFSASAASGISSTNITNWNTAYGWGDHGAEGYLTGNQTITLTGDVSGSGTTSIAVTIADDSHNHVISNVDGLQTALNAKQDASTALTTSTTFGGDVSGAYNAIVVADDSHNHVISNVDGLQSALDAKLASSSYTAADVLTKIKTVDGSGSGLDADLLDGLHSSAFEPANATILHQGSDIGNQDWNTFIDGTEASWNTVLNHSGSNRPSSAYTYGTALSFSKAAQAKLQIYAPETSSAGGTSAGMWYRTGWNTSYRDWQRIWDSGNDGSGSGLDADLLDGVQGSSYLRSDANDTATGIITFSTASDAQITLDGAGTAWAGIKWNDVNGYDHIWYNGQNSTFSIGGSGANVSGKKLHVDGGMSVGSSSESTATPTDGIYSQGAISTADAFRSSRFEEYDGTFAFRISGASGTTRHINLWDSTSDPSQADGSSVTGISWGKRTDSNPYYIIYTDKLHAYNGDYSKLILAWHTGVHIGAHTSYGGTRFWSNSPGIGSASELMSVGKGDNHVRVTNNIYASLFGDLNNTGFYVDPAATSNLNNVDADGFYTTSNPWNTGNSAWMTNGITTPNVTSWIYGTVYLGNAPSNGSGSQADANGIETAGWHKANVYYERANTAYYADPSSISNFYGLAIRGDASSTDSANQIFFWSTGDTTTSAIGFKANGGEFGNPTGQGDGYNTYFTMDTVNRGWVFRRGTGGTNFTSAYTAGWILNNGIAQFNASTRSPIFYDSNNTAYYVDPSSTTNSAVIAGSVNAQTYNKPGLLLNSSGTSSSGAAFGMQQVTSEGWTGIFVDYEPFTGWGLYHDNPNNYFCVTAESSTGNLRSFTVPSRVSGNRTAYEKIRFDQANAIGTAGGSWRAPIFYDSNNTAYYTDPASTSILNTVLTYGHITINNNNPTIFLQDTDHRSSMIHCNSNLFYILRGSGTNSTSWATANGHWPVYISLETNDANFGRNITAVGNVTAYSDARKKKDIRPLEGASDYLNALDAKRYKWKLDDREDIGFIAQDVEAAGLDVFVIENERKDPDTGEHIESVKSLDYGRMVSVLWQAVKEQQDQIEAMAAEIKSLKEMKQ